MLQNLRELRTFLEDKDLLSKVKSRNVKITARIYPFENISLDMIIWKQ